MPSTAYDMGRSDYMLGKSMSDNRFKTTHGGLQNVGARRMDAIRADQTISDTERAALLGDEVES